MCMKLFAAVLIISGTYLLSKRIFENSFQEQIRFTFSELPLSFKIALYVFGDKEKFENKQLWNREPFPIPGNFNCKQKFWLLAPFIGFILICLGTFMSILL